MRLAKASLFMTLAVAWCVPALSVAQTPDFSGTWVLDPSKSAVTGLPASIGGPVRAEGLTGPARVGGDMRPPSKIKDMKPVYPAKAMSDGIDGLVVIEATIDTEGNVTNPVVIQSIPALDQAALDAVKQWKFTPSIIRGVPSPVRMTLTVNFALGAVKPGQGAPMRPPIARPPGPPPSASTGAAVRMTIAQTAETLTMTRDNPNGQTVTVYRLDGTESRNSVTSYPPRGSGAAPLTAELIYRSRWVGSRLVTSITTAPGSDGPPERTQTVSLEGDTLLIETTGPGPRSATVVQKVVYVRGSTKTPH